MRSEQEMIAYALVVDPELLPLIPDLLADLDELGSDAELIIEVLADLRLPNSTRVIDLGCGKGAIAVKIAAMLGFHVDGIDLFEPFIIGCRERAAVAGVSDHCRFQCADILKIVDAIEPTDIAIFAALGDVLGPLEVSTTDPSPMSTLDALTRPPDDQVGPGRTRKVGQQPVESLDLHPVLVPDDLVQ